MGTANLIVVQAQLADDQNIAAENRLDLPDEPPLQGGILSHSAESRFEHRSTPENLGSSAFDDATVDGDGISFKNFTEPSPIACP